MTCLPTTREGMESAIGQHIHGLVACNIEVAQAIAAARAAEPGYVPEKFVWEKKTTPPPKFSMETYCASIRAGIGSKRGMRA